MVLAAGASAAASASIAVFGTGVAAADTPNVIGQKYSDASKTLTDAGLKPVVATVVGDRLSHDQCLVTGATQPKFLDATGASKGSLIQLTLNCYANMADDNSPGVSAGAVSPDAQAVKNAVAAQAASEGAVTSANPH
jgi:hypothetical protein